MVFSSVPASLDPPNWNQQQLLQLPATQVAGGDAYHVLPGLAAAQPADAIMAAAESSSARPISMTERARQAKIVPQPQLPLKCPRCESTNTKFCYFNNYSLSQPRHFCKTCRRYWTRGGALRSVPVGGGCRRNKRSKSSSSSKSAAAASAVDQRQAGGASSSSCTVDAGGIMPRPRQFPLLASAATGDYGTSSRLGLDHIAGSRSTLDAEEQYQVGSGSSSALWLEQWRMPQFPLLGGGLMEAAQPPDVQPLYHFNIDGGSEGGTAKSQVLEQLAPVKTEDRNNNFHLPRQLYLGLQTQNDRHWSSGGWASTDLPRFNSS